MSRESKTVYPVMGPPPFDTMGLFTFLRTYARRHDENDINSTVENWQETLERVVNACNSQLNVGFSDAEKKELFTLLYNLKCSVAGRFLWQLGTQTVNKLGLPSLQNCSHVVINEPITPFTWAMNFLMLGAGVGYRILPEDIAKLPPVKYALVTRKDTKDADFIVPDSREGWIKLLGKTLKAHFYSGQNFTYSCTLLRSKGAPIKSFGGTASGPDVLCDGIEKINTVLNKRSGQNLRPIDALDIMNIIGMIVVSGNVRRSAQIALGSIHDKEYLQAKRWDLGNIPNWRAFSNNSVIVDDINDVLENKEFWKGYDGTGEPYGLINLKLARSCGRLGEFQYPDPDLEGFNPCSEQGLGNKETCCLGELFLPNITTKDELLTCATYIYRICKHSLTLPCIDSKETEQIVHRNMRMGIGVSGYLQATDEQRSWLDECYRYLRSYDKEYSRIHGFPVSIKIGTVKPSGCSRKDMLVLTTNGLLRLDEIGDIQGDEWQKVENLQVFTDQEKTEYVTKFYVNGTAQTRIIRTEDGNELESSMEHKYRVVKDGKYFWKKVENLEIGDMLVVKLGDHPENIVTKLTVIELECNTNCQNMKQPEFLTKDIAWFLGLFYGDGSVHKKGIRISFNRKQPALLQWLDKFFTDTFNLRTTIDDDHCLYVNSQQLLQWLDKNNCLKDYAHDLTVPKIIRTSSKENVCAFIDGFWRADGGIHNTGNTWSVCSVSEKFAREFFCLCRSVGYNMKLSCAGPGGLGSKDRWILHVRKLDQNKMRYVSKEFKSRIYENYWLDPIVSLEESSCETFDIEVENAHHYRIGGTISHNTLSILANCTPGIHPGFSRYYKRRVRIATGSPLISLAKEHGYDVEYVQNFDGTLDYTTQIVTFPMCLPEHTVLAENCSAIQQLEWVKKAQTEWSDNSVSVTVYYRKEELPAIKDWLKKNYNTSVKTVSFLLHSEHGFKQAPMEQVTKEEYEDLAAKCRPIVDLEGVCYSSVDADVLANEKDCSSGSCPKK